MARWRQPGVDHAAFGDYRVLLLLAPFAFGILFALFGDKIPIDNRLAIACVLIAGSTYAKGGWLVLGQYAFCYLLIWFAIKAKFLKSWDSTATSRTASTSSRGRS